MLVECAALDVNFTPATLAAQPVMDDALRRRLLEAVDHALAGDWQAAHVIAQDHEDEPLANWIHAVAHRMEGDRKVT